MHEWKCEHCGEKMYSANEDAEKKTVKCIYCKKSIKNPYFKGLKSKAE